jgi:hypothetical protein
VRSSTLCIAAELRFHDGLQRIPPGGRLSHHTKMGPRLAQRSHTQTNSVVIIGDRYPADQFRHASHPWNIA